jgi:hypothetical protein
MSSGLFVISSISTVSRSNENYSATSCLNHCSEPVKGILLSLCYCCVAFSESSEPIESYHSLFIEKLCFIAFDSEKIKATNRHYLHPFQIHMRISEFSTLAALFDPSKIRLALLYTLNGVTKPH